MQESEEPLILSIETATRAGSVALSRGQALLSSRTGDPTRSHSTDLLELIRDALREAGASLSDVELFAAALGPGSFTGLRIGVATVKGLASTLERRVVGVPTLEALALAAGRAERVVALLPAGRGELFAQSFRVEGPHEVSPLDEPVHVAPDILLEKYRGQRSVIWIGEGALAQREKIRAVAEEDGIAFIEESAEQSQEEREGAWTLASLPENLAAYVGLVAFEKHKRQETGRPEELQAIYVRPSDAELKEKCRTQG
ncbi:MAG TPA: tRNA (adenosine(37)-N6)-threonylcarbamoyltransferase complex dimerization subunit type 1 TsaB [Pyrinomonadaceae bacterium]|nr:tRNA (adenosine(37)-N6)-threonylcarbamoyltransferase complex dimerization subunit type 1 TsaB [Pyrinomonadaceae bacterium]